MQFKFNSKIFFFLFLETSTEIMSQNIGEYTASLKIVIQSGLRNLDKSKLSVSVQLCNSNSPYCNEAVSVINNYIWDFQCHGMTVYFVVFENNFETFYFFLSFFEKITHSL